MLNQLWNLIIANLSNVAIGVGIFVLAYVSNMLLGIYYNVGLCGYKFEWKKILKSLVKIICVGLGIAFLTISVTLILPFAEANGLPIPDEYKEVVELISTLFICLNASLRYIKEGMLKLNDILNKNYIEWKEVMPESESELKEDTIQVIDKNNNIEDNNIIYTYTNTDNNNNNDNNKNNINIKSTDNSISLLGDVEW